MVNLLICLVAEKAINSNMIEKIKKIIRPDHLYMIVAYREELEKYKKYGTCVLRDQAVLANYNDTMLGLENGIPLEDPILQFMNIHSTEIMYQQRRFESYPDLSIEPDLNRHYTVYMHNLYFWYNFLIREKITHVFMGGIPHEGFSAIIYYLCQYMHIPLQMTHSCFIPGREYPLRDFMQDAPALQKEYKKLLEQYRGKDIEDIPLEGGTAEAFARWMSLQPDQMTPWYVRGNAFARRMRQRFYETNVIRLWRGILGEDYVRYGFGFSFIKAAFFKIPKLLTMIPVAYKRWHFAKPIKKKSLAYRRYYEKLAQFPIEGEKYVYFPLQYQPEATSNPMGGDMYSDQMIPLYILSRALPEDTKLYVKIHPEQLALMHTRDYYDDIVKIPKVRLMKINTSTYDLMKNAVAVASLTGTALWECQFFGVPALVFGYSVKNMAPLSYHVRTVEDCKRAFEEISNRPRRNVDVLRELKIYTKALHNISFLIEERGDVLPDLIADFVNDKTLI